MKSIDLRHKRVMIREDFNVPLDNEGKITSDTRIQAALPTIRLALEQHAKVILLSHLGRPVEGQYEERYSLLSVAEKLSQLLGRPVRLVKNWLQGIEVEEGEVVLCENVRFNFGENADDDLLSQKMAVLCDVFVMDAFATAHRAQASTHGIAKYAAVACAGPLMMAEVEALTAVMDNPARPLLAIVGGAKISSKLALLENLSRRTDQLIVGGGIANTFLAAAGYPIGCSLYEPDSLSTAEKLLAMGKVPLPIDVVTATAFSAEALPVIKAIADVAPDEMILDIGPKTLAAYTTLIDDAKTILWNGPVGVFEFPAFVHGTAGIARAIALSQAYSVAGGGDTLAAIELFGLASGISSISTGGGAFLEYMEGKELPAITILNSRNEE
ncbi:MAG: phosphoglycerate kinase [Legionellales bacterium]|nr:phosphoglycerate kinase [Legionellales bacterium]